ncbi:putative lipoprotein [Pseudobythopirellula maris]|uniref:Putative lipoprotein n=1 Tax=Pseudobythopirellula maris TaxID=2527991 RepID=A0A5C5ZP75_9BACT|nr:hypothetical protein [Pseudobythopirellula maris]TWT89000.1 putative lipoprotein [Pseudobythopirellula maris]
MNKLHRWALTGGLAWAVLSAGYVRADITLTGDASPEFTGTPTHWRVAGVLTVGDTGVGALEIDSAGVYSSHGYLGLQSGSSGAATLSTSGVWSLDYQLHVGHGGTGQLDLWDNTVARIDGRSYLGYAPGSVGVVSVNDRARFEAGEGLSIGVAGRGVMTIASEGGLSTDGYLSNIILGRCSDSNPEELGDGTLIFTGDGTLVELDETELIVGEYGRGEVVVEAGARLYGNEVRLGLHAGSTAVARVEGVGSEWTLTGDEHGYLDSDFYVGYDGEGVLDISEGAIVRSDQTYVAYEETSVGRVRVSGAGAELQSSGIELGTFGGKGTMIIEQGAMVHRGNASPANANVIGSSYHDGTGEVIVRNPGSTWRLPQCEVDNGTLTVADGGLVDTRDLIINEHGVVTVTGRGSKLETIGFDGNLSNRGKLYIEQGGVIDSDYAGRYSRYQPVGLVEAVVTGVGSQWNIVTDLMWFALRDSELTIADGGVVNVKRDTFTDNFIGQESPYSNTIRFDGGTLNTASLYSSPERLLGEGTIHTAGFITDYDITFDASTGTQPTIVLNDLPGQNVTVHMDLSDPEYTRTFGIGFAGEGTLTISEGVVIDSKFNRIGVKTGSMGHVIITGAGSAWKAYGGFGGGFGVGQEGDGRITIKDGGALHGSPYIKADSSESYVNMTTGGMIIIASSSADSVAHFSSGSEAVNFWDGSQWTPLIEGVVGIDYSIDSYIENERVFSRLTVHLAGDYDGDGLVTLDDYTVWTEQYGETGDWGADGNHDGVVDAADFTVWRDHFTSVAQTLTTPEPASAALLLLMAAAAAATRRRA